MNIKEFLRKNSLTLTEFSTLINLSRPTLNNYINLFEEKKDLPNENYDKLFKILFKKEEYNKKELLTIIKQNLNLINSDEAPLYTEENKALMGKIIEKMQQDLKGENADNSLYKFINSSLSNYNKDNLLTCCIRYFLYLNGLKNLDEATTSEKIFFSHFFTLMTKMKSLESNNSLTFDSEGFDNFKKRIYEIKEKRDNIQKKFEYIFKTKLKIELENQLEHGTPIEEINVNDILKNLRNNTTIEDIIKK